jgi:hypothetical protein
VPTLEDVQRQRQGLDDVITLAKAELVSLWPSLPTDVPEQLKDQLLDVMVALVADYGSQAAVLAADWYAELRAEAPTQSSYLALMAATATAEAMASEVGYAGAGAYVSPTKALIDAAAVLDKFVGYGQRDTIDLNVNMDPEPGVTWARIAQSDACAFCAMLATRTDYRSQGSAIIVTGAGSRPSRQGKRALGEKYHDDCRCVATPVFTGLEYEYPAETQVWAQLYEDAAQNLPTGRRDTKAILAYMRQHGGLR